MDTSSACFASLRDARALGECMAFLARFPRTRRVKLLSELLFRRSAEEAAEVAAFCAGQPLPVTEQFAPLVAPLAARRALERASGVNARQVDSAVEAAGGFAEAVRLLHLPSPERAGVSLLEVKQWFLAARTEKGDGEALAYRLITQLPLEAAVFLLRASLGILPLELDAEAVLLACAFACRLEPAALLSCYQLTLDLEDTVARAFRGLRALAQVQCRSGRPYRFSRVLPMERLDDVLARLEAPYLVEPSLPGIRIQVHRRHAHYQMFNEQARDITACFPELLPQLERHLKGTDDLILEGAVWVPGLAPDRSRVLVRRRLSRETDDNLTPVLTFTSMIRQGRENLMSLPRLTRRKRLADLVGHPPTYMLCPFTLCRDLQEVEAARVPLREAGGGFLIGSASAPYVAGETGSSYDASLPASRVTLAVVSAVLNTSGTPIRVTLAARNQIGLERIGELSLAAHPDELLERLNDTLARYAIEWKSGLVVLRPGSVVDVNLSEERVLARRRRTGMLAGAVLNDVRDDLDEGAVFCLERLAARIDPPGRAQEAA